MVRKSFWRGSLYRGKEEFGGDVCFAEPFLGRVWGLILFGCVLLRQYPNSGA